MDYKGILFFGNIKTDSQLFKVLEDTFVDISTHLISEPLNEAKKHLKQGKIPYFILSTSDVIKWMEESNKYDQYMSFFLSYPKDELQTGHIKQKEFAYKSASYVLTANDYTKVAKLVSKLWDFRNSGGVLSRDLINLMISCDMLILDADEQSISNASYDLRLGEEYFYGGEISLLNDQKPFIKIEPYDYVIASCKELTNLPRDISARFDISVNLFCQGIIMSNSTQVDPGFRGKLFCLLFNTSNKTVYIKKDTHFTTVEFHKLLEPTTPYSGKYNEKNSILYYLPPNVMQGAINELKIEIENLKRDNKNMQNHILGLVSLFLALIAIMMVL